MEAKLLQNIQTCPWLNIEKVIMKPGGVIGVAQWTKRTNTILSMQSNSRRTLAHCKPRTLKVFSSLEESAGSVLELGNLPITTNEALVLKDKSAEIEPYLSGRCIYLVGMMGSGKTTIAKLLAKCLGYTFVDSDSLVEEDEKMSVAEMFKLHGEGFFRIKETEVLQKVSMMDHLVVSTGGGAVIQPFNWMHMRKGVSVWIDVPLECLARRTSAVGTGTRPLLDGSGEPGDAYTKAYKRLVELFEERHESYANANARVSLQNIATKDGYKSVDELTPGVIAIEVLEQIGRFLNDGDVEPEPCLSL